MTHPSQFFVDLAPMSIDEFNRRIRFPNPNQSHSIPIKDRLFLVDMLVSMGETSQTVNGAEQFVPQYAPAHYVTDSIVLALQLITCEAVFQHRISMIRFPKRNEESLDYSATPKMVTMVWESRFYDDDQCEELTVRSFEFHDGAIYTDRKLTESQQQRAAACRKCRYQVSATIHPHIV